MLITDLIWDERNVEHIARHQVEPHEVEQVIWDDPHARRGPGKSRYRLYGQTDAGRYLFIVLDREYDDVFYVVTARDMDKREKKQYRRGK
jgi:uncharacterized DUF497 family protein